MVAFQKAVGLERDGIVGPMTKAALDDGTTPAARTTSGRVVEIDRGRQLLLLVQDGVVEWVFDTSTGREGFRTPGGEFSIYAETNNLNESGLGVTYRPKFFYRDRELAIHGYTNVPPYPRSHGCARVIYPAMDWLWEHGRIPVGTSVVVY